MNFARKDIRVVIEEYKEFLVNKKKLKAFDSYTPGIYDYLNSYILNKVDINDFESIFNIESILKFSNDNPRNQFVYSILHLLDFFANEKEKIPYVRWLEIRENIQREFREINRSRKVRDTVDFLSLEAIDFIFGGNASYNTDEEKFTAPLIYALSFFCGFEQRHIMNLRISDINFDDKLIRNIKNLQFIEWIEMDEKIYNYIMKYYNYREQLKVEFEELILINSEPPRKDLNNIYAIMTRVDNNRHINIKSIDASLLVRSMVYYSLISSSGKRLKDFALEFKLTSKSFLHAYSTYSSKFSSSISIRDKLTISELHVANDIIVKTDANESLLLEGLESVIDVLATNSQNNNFEHKDIDLHKLFSAYLEENDIGLDDLNNFELNNTKNNLQESKVIIQRMVRDSQIAQFVKARYENRCQVCNYQLRNSDGGFYSEAHHIKPYNKIHRGDDTIRNMIVLCPNCHTQFDNLYYAIEPDTMKIKCLFEDDEYHNERLDIKDWHELGEEYLQYCWNLFLEKKKTIAAGD